MPFFRKKKRAHPAIKQVKKMQKAIEKGKRLPDLEVASRQDIVTRLFVNRMMEAGLEPSADSGYVPVSYTPLARFLRDCGLSDVIAEAILSGILEETTEEGVRTIIAASADTPDISLTQDELKHAQDLAVEEWRRKKKSMEL
ncbi:MAG: hypothetical protein ACTSYL_12020 [Candidatus Thorarchaeota archaeon]